jgi:hypothetical protein
VVSFAVGDPWVSDGNLEVSAVVENVGDQNAGSFSVSYHVATEVSVGSSDTLLDSFTVAGGLTAGDQVADGPRILDLSGLDPGIYYVGLVVDGANEILETVEGDNTSVLRVVVLSPADDLEENDTRDSAAPIQLIAGQAELTGLTLHDRGDVDFFRLDLPGTGGSQDLVALSYVSVEPALKLSLLSSDGTLLRSVFGEYGLASVSLADLKEDRYFILVEGASAGGFSTGYTLTVDAAGTL